MLQTRFAFNSPVLFTEVQLGETRGHVSSKSQKNTAEEGIPFCLAAAWVPVVLSAAAGYPARAMHVAVPRDGYLHHGCSEQAFFESWHELELVWQHEISSLEKMGEKRK